MDKNERNIYYQYYTLAMSKVYDFKKLYPVSDGNETLEIMLTEFCRVNEMKITDKATTRLGTYLIGSDFVITIPDSDSPILKPGEYPALLNKYKNKKFQYVISYDFYGNSTEGATTYSRIGFHKDNIINSTKTRNVKREKLHAKLWSALDAEESKEEIELRVLDAHCFMYVLPKIAGYGKLTRITGLAEKKRILDKHKLRDIGTYILENDPISQWCELRKGDILKNVRKATTGERVEFYKVV